MCLTAKRGFPRVRGKRLTPFPPSESREEEESLPQAAQRRNHRCRARCAIRSTGWDYLVRSRSKKMMDIINRYFALKKSEYRLKLPKSKYPLRSAQFIRWFLNTLLLVPCDDLWLLDENNPRIWSEIWLNPLTHVRTRIAHGSQIIAEFCETSWMLRIPTNQSITTSKIKCLKIAIRKRRN